MLAARGDEFGNAAVTAAAIVTVTVAAPAFVTPAFC